MIVRSMSDIQPGHERYTQSENWHSRRIVLAQEGVGFSLHETVLYAGTVNDMWYANHVEAVYCIGGKGDLLDKETGESYRIEPGTMYLLDGHEKHRLSCETEMTMVCVFNPPVTGQEVHDEHGVYPLIIPNDVPTTTEGAKEASA
ncbi:ectoine synthase [Herbihabitans rhizosphaerae]|uniref:L-ectoine synthase n=1 Tax=Herbihabitans rhizosphaerae TaxID=1872711 RepID=A0A4Q7L835_9PSEU|nr:ectoine synthase [Herbihabitans rhizosphaerae]RZS44811.1 ectoine synthase [Herbihabitans rhizosphaerae]